MKVGNFSLMLHSHLPWVLNHGKWPFGEDWITEGAFETYLPLLNMSYQLVSENIKPNYTIGFSPVLAEQLSSKDFLKSFKDYRDIRIKEAKMDYNKFKSANADPHLVYMATWWENFYYQLYEDFEKKYDKDIIGAFKALQDDGHIEIVTCGATHGYFPLLAEDASINLQVKLAKENYKKHFGKNPRGIWLPECAYRPSYTWQSFIPVEPYNHPHHRAGMEEFLARHEIEYFFTDEVLINQSEFLGWFHNSDKNYFVDVANHDYIFRPNSLNLYNVSSSKNTIPGTAVAFSRHREMAMQVWSAENGYPGHGDYLDFHKREDSSLLRYWRITDLKLDMQYKDLYRPDWTYDKIDHQSNHFIHHLENTAHHFSFNHKKMANICIPFDTELFGHWWFEGINFLEKLIRGLNHSPHIEMKQCGKVLDENRPSEIIRLKEGSWGKNNTHEVWSNDNSIKLWENVYNTERKLKKEIMPNRDSSMKVKERILKQIFREYLLMLSSDWEFLIDTGTAYEYSFNRFYNHLTDFNKLSDLYLHFSSKTEKEVLKAMQHLELCEKRNSAFSEINPDWFTNL